MWTAGVETGDEDMSCDDDHNCVVEMVHDLAPLLSSAINFTKNAIRKWIIFLCCCIYKVVLN